MRVGMRVVFIWSIFGALWMYLAASTATSEAECSKNRTAELHAREERRKLAMLASITKRGARAETTGDGQGEAIVLEMAEEEGRKGAAGERQKDEVRTREKRTASAPFAGSLSRLFGVEISGAKSRQARAESIDRVFDQEIEALAWDREPTCPSEGGEQGA